jgi:hypothetical protein
VTALFLGIGLVIFLILLGRGYVQASPASIARGARYAGAAAAGLGAVLLALRGRFDMAGGLGMLALWLAGMGPFSVPTFARRTTTTPGAVSTVRSAMLEMSLDHDTGEMNGVVLAGSLAGRRLDELDAAALSALARELAAADPDGIRLLEAYMDRRFPRWREDTQFDADTRRGGAAGAASGSPGSGAMTREEAYEVLGLAPGAGDDQIRRAHRDLMKKLHPDQGGSTYLAARVNQAKDILLGRHR